MKSLAKISSVVLFACAISGVAHAADEEPAKPAEPWVIHVSIDGAVNYTLQDVRHVGWYHSVVLSPQMRVTYGREGKAGFFLALGDGLISSILDGPSAAKPSGAVKVNESQFYVQGGLNVRILKPDTCLTVGAGYLNQRIDVESDKYKGGFFVGIGLSVPIATLI